MKFFTNRNNDEEYVEVENRNLSKFLDFIKNGNDEDAYKFATASDSSSSDAVARTIDAVKNQHHR